MGPPLAFGHPASLRHLTGGGHPERPARIAAIEAELDGRAWLGYERREAPRVALDVLAAVHPATYVQRIRDACAASELFWPDTATSPGSFEAALRAAGGACALVDALVAGDSPTGIVLARPPGHHATATAASGFCLFNSIAVAARYALDRLGVERVAIVDWDVHHGDGTQAVFAHTDRVLYASIHQSPLFPGTGRETEIGHGHGAGFTVNLPVAPGTDEEVWRSLVEHIVVPVVEAFAPQLILISAGFDGHRDDPLADGTLTADTYAELARHVAALGRRCGAPVGAILEGGYDLPALAASVAATMAALAGDQPPAEIAPDPIYTRRAAAWVATHWPL